MTSEVGGRGGGEVGVIVCWGFAACQGVDGLPELLAGGRVVELFHDWQGDRVFNRCV